MPRQAFSFADIAQDCRVEYSCYQWEGRPLGVRIYVPEALYDYYPYNASAYVLMQQLRDAIRDHAMLEFPQLPVNRTNYTLAQRSPKEHAYSSNPYMTDICQQPHQDTPPYPTAFWLDEPRRFFATWVMTESAAQGFYAYANQHPGMDVERLHKTLVPQSVADRTGALFNQSPGLFIFDNSEQHRLYHARTCNFAAVAQQPDYCSDAPMYAFNEVGLLHYIDSLDSRRGPDDRDAQDLAEVKRFLAQEAQA